MLLSRKCVIRRGTSIKQIVTQPLIRLLFLRGADSHQRQTPSRKASLNSPESILRPCASCGGSGSMTFIKHFENILSAAQIFTFTRSNRQRAATLVLTVGVLVPPGLLAGELDEQEHHPSTQQVALQIPPPEPEEHTTPRPQFKSLEQQRLLSVEQEAKIQAQTQYLAAKFRQSESAILKYVELAWKEASKRDGMSPELLLAMMQKESSLRPKVQSRYGAQGLMQVVRRWHPDKLHPSESLFDPEVNIRVGADVLEEYLEKAGGSLNKALGKYSGSEQGYATRVLNESYKLDRVAAEAASQVLASEG